MSGPVYWNGRLVEAAEVRISPADAGLLAGDGLFETLRVEAGRARDIPAHLERLAAGLNRIGIVLPEDREGLAAAVARVAAAAPRPLARLRVTITRGEDSDGAPTEPTRLIQTWPYQPPGEADLREGVAALLLSDLRLDAGSPLAGLKSLSYQAFRLALGRAAEVGCREALLSNRDGRLAEGSRSNLVLVQGGRAVTPPLSDGALPGTVRRRLLEQGLLEERSLTPNDLHWADEVLLLNSLIGVLPVGRIVRPAGSRQVRMGAVAGRLRQAWEEATARL